MSLFRPAIREQLKLRLALAGPSGSGKSFTALRLAFALGRVAVIDTEHRAAEKYKGLAPDGVPWNFDVCNLAHFDPLNYVEAIQAAAGYDVLVIDSISHAWDGVGGALDQVDKKGGNKFTAWKDVTPRHRRMVEAMLACPCHLIVTLRTKTEYVIEEQINRAGKIVQVPRKVGMQPVQRAGMEYEFDLVADMDLEHNLRVSKTRCPAVDGWEGFKPGPEFLRPVMQWLNEGEPPGPQPPGGPPPSAASAPPPRLPPANEPPSYAEDLTDRCRLDQAGRISTLIAAMGMPSWAYQQMLSSRGVSDLEQLTAGQATELIAKLERLQSEQELQAAMDGGFGGGAPAEAAPAGGTDAPLA
jgi:hypothetical protein